MEDNSKNGLVGAALIGLGCGMTAIGIALVIPAVTNWSFNMVESAVDRGRKKLDSSVGSAASFAGQLRGVAQRKFDEASRSARQTTAKAAGVVETAARHVREHAS